MSKLDSNDILASVIIEWENMEFAEDDRCRDMLKALATQMQKYVSEHAELSRPFEVSVLFDKEKVASETIDDFVRPYFPADFAAANVRYVASSGLPYYEQKNHGAQQSAGKYIIFLDSDVVPESGWLKNLLATFDNSDVQVACGNCYLATEDEGVVSQTFALSWIFPLRMEETEIRKQNTFFANNVAFRRETALKYPFKPIDGTSRGACRMLGRRLKADGIDIYLNTAAQVSHPAPNGVSHLVTRAVSQGRDNLMFAKQFGRGAFVRSLARACRQQLRAWRRIVWHHREVKMPVVAVPFALAIASSYYSCYFLGDMLARISPKYMETRFQI